VILGVSRDTVESHKAFVASSDIPFPLLADVDGAIATRYGVDASDGTADRVTFLVGRDGVIARTWPKVTITGHEAEVLAAIRALPPAP